MANQYFLFQSHLDLAHQYWEKLILPGDLIIDATCGNGHDTLKLVQLAISEKGGAVYALDIQPQAIESARHFLISHLPSQSLSHIHFHQRCHSAFPSEILPGTVKLIVYNLGYLPKGDKSLTTQTNTTLESLQQAQKLIMTGGAISITCYSGHEAGAMEEKAVLDYAASLPKQEWSCCHHRWLNRNKAPSLLLIQKSLENR